MVTPLPSPRGGEERPVDRRVVRSISFSACFLRQVLRRFAHLEKADGFCRRPADRRRETRDAKLGAKLGDRRDVPQFLRGLSNKGEVRLSGISRGFLGSASLLRSKQPQG